MRPYIHDTTLFFWTIDVSVGKNAMNSQADDVSYIQWYYTLLANHPETAPHLRPIYQQVKVTGQCTGKDSDPLVKAIIAQQQYLQHPVVDGRISVLPGSSGEARLGNGNAFFIIRQGARFASMFPEVWPRIDKLPGCPPCVAETVREAVPRI